MKDLFTQEGEREALSEWFGKGNEEELVFEFSIFSFLEQEKQKFHLY